MRFNALIGIHAFGRCCGASCPDTFNNESSYTMKDKNEDSLSAFQIKNDENMNQIIDKDDYECIMSEEKNNFCYYFIPLFNCCCSKKRNNFDVYSKFRGRIISEENLAKNYLNLYNLLKVNQYNRPLNN